MAKNKKSHDSGTNSTLLRNSIRKWWFLFLLPTFAAFCMGFIYPFGQGIFLSFCKFKRISKTTFVGFDNFVRAFQDSNFTRAFGFTTIFAVVSVVLINLFAFVIAYLLTQKIKGSNLFRTAFFMPNLIGGIVLGYIWKVIFDGILSQFATSITSNSVLGFWGLIILMCWQQIGYIMIIYIAGFQAVSEDMLEAARIDGATRMQTLFKVTIPNMMSSFTICLFLTLTNGFKLFDQNLALTGGQPFIIQADGTSIKQTEMIALNIVNTLNTSSPTAKGVAQAKAVIFFIVVAVISIIQLAATRRKEVQQ